MEHLHSILTLVAALGSALMGGLFFAFSNVVMRSLFTRPPSDGVATMQTINRVILNPLFFVLFIGTALICGALVVMGLNAPQVPAASVTGAAAYLLGVFGVTAVVNVPLNNQLDRVAPTSPEAAAIWRRFEDRWTTYNHVRSVFCVVAAILVSAPLSGF